MKTEQNLSTSSSQQKNFDDPPPQFDSSDLGSPKKVWTLLREKDEKFRRDPQMFARQLKITAKMRSMLFDWLMDVCADKHLHRETFHLCIDYIDRYIALSNQQVHPHRLQLIGSTALVIASKIEEIYPPKISEIADYSDGCCIEADIKSMEELMLEKLGWACYPVTAIHWLALYMQLMSTNEVIPARQVTITAAKAMDPNLSIASTNSADFESNHFDSFLTGPPSLEVSIVSACNDENIKPDGSRMDSVDPSPSIDSTSLPLSVEMQRIRTPLSSGRRISFSCSYPRVHLSHIGSSPRVLLHTTQADITYVGHSSYTSGHIYPDQRCTVPKLMRGEFVRLASILDLILLDVDSLDYRYSELASAVILCCYEPENLIYQITGFAAEKMREARAYVEPFVEMFDKFEPTGTPIPCLTDIPHNDQHNIQTYSQNCLVHLEKVQQFRKATELRRKALNIRMAARMRKRKFGSTLNHSRESSRSTTQTSRTTSYGL